MGKRRRKKKGKKGKRGKRTVFARFAQHPGTKAQPFLAPALEGANKLLTAVLGDTIRRVGVSNPTRLIRAMDKDVKAVATAVERRAKQLVPVDTSKLKGSINTRKERLLSYTVGTNVEYAEFVEKGTTPHVIFPKNKKVLRFVVKGRRSRKAVGRKGRRP